jgi:transcription termination/antitermination protein NusG
VSTATSELLQWFALRVKSNREKVTFLGLSGKGYDVFLPQYRPPANPPTEKERPLFPGYLFCRFDVKNRLPILTVPGLVHIVGIGNTPVPVDEQELESLRVLVHAGLPLNRDEPYVVGQAVRIDAGPLAGACGVVTGLRERRLVVSITLLQRSISVELRREWISA